MACYMCRDDRIAQRDTISSVRENLFGVIGTHSSRRVLPVGLMIICAEFTEQTAHFAAKLLYDASCLFRFEERNRIDEYLFWSASASLY
jgi:hypothetical protein